MSPTPEVVFETANEESSGVNGADDQIGLEENNTVSAGHETKSLPVVSALDSQLAPVMFAASLLFLANLSALLHLTDGNLQSWYASVFLKMGAILHLAFVAEGLFQKFHGGNMRRWHWWSILIPPLRMGARDHGTGEHVWLPGMGWRLAGKECERSLAKFFSMPLMILALIVLPLVVIELWFVATLDAHPAWKKWLELASGLIWMAFVIEFVLMVGVTAKKVRYVRTNWVDVIIVLLPFVQLAQSARLARLMRLNQVARTARVYRVRGLMVRMWRVLVALDLIEKFVWRDKLALIESLEEQLVEQELVADELRDRIATLKRLHASEASEESTTWSNDRDFR